MKTLKLLAFGIVLLVSSNSNAQISVNLNIGTAPVYHHPAPAVVVDYYYLPDIQSYFDVRANLYVYLDRGNWVRSRNLPPQYCNYDARNGYRVALNDYHGNQPYCNFYNDRTRYYVGYRGDNHKYESNRYKSQEKYYKKNNKYWKDNKYASNDRDHKGRDRHDD